MAVRKKSLAVQLLLAASSLLCAAIPLQTIEADGNAVAVPGSAYIHRRAVQDPAKHSKRIDNPTLEGDYSTNPHESPDEKMNRLFTAATLKGRHLEGLFKRSLKGSDDVKPSKWLKFSELHANDWKEESSLQKSDKEFEGIGHDLLLLAPEGNAGNEKFPSQEGGHWQQILWSNNLPSRAGQVGRRVSLNLAFSPRYETILYEEDSMYEAQAASDGLKEGELHELRSWSDVAYLTWASLFTQAKGLDPGNVPEIKRILVHEIGQRETSLDLILHKALGPTYVQSLGRFGEAKVFLPGTQTFDAILGSATGQQIAAFLLEHKKQLGETRSITRMRMWVPKKGEDPCLLFEISESD